MLLSENNSAYFGSGVGDTVEILGAEFLVGIHGTAGVSDRQEHFYMNLSDAQKITSNIGMITAIEVFAESAENVTFQSLMR